jgi:hypothetical protein
MPTNPGLQVSFALECVGRFDEQAKVFVGYIPALGIYSQGTSKEQLEKAVESAALMFISTCYEKQILGKYLHDRGLTKAASLEAVDKDKQHIVVADYRPTFDSTFKVNVPMELLGQTA